MPSRTTFRRFVVPELSLLRVALSAAFIYAAVGAWVWVASDRMIFLPPAPSYRDMPDVLRLPTAGGERIAGLHLRIPAATYTMLLSHGNAEDLGLVRPLLPVLGDLGFSVFAYDYRGYGLSEGVPSEPNVYGDIDAAYDHLTRELRVPPERIILYGRSLGAGAAVDLAARRFVGGLILESPFLTAFRVLTRVPLLPFDKFRNVDKIGRVRCPVLIMHGEADEIVPVWHGRKLFERAPGPKMFVVIPGAHHNDFMWVAGARYAAALHDFEALLRGR
jgi:abhydrolase domain-containing protein 17